MKKCVIWLFVLGIGFALMLFSYYGFQHFSISSQWEDVFLCIGNEVQEPNDPNIQYTKKPVRLLPATEKVQVFKEVARSFGSNAMNTYLVCLREKLLLYPEMASDFNESMLQWGRFPVPGSPEVVAGFSVKNKDKIIVEGFTLNIVGKFKRDLHLYADSYLISESLGEIQLFDPDDKDVRNAFIFEVSKVSKEELTNSETRKKLFEFVEESNLIPNTPTFRVKPGPFLLYMSGLMLLLLGGSVALYKFYCFLANHYKNKWLCSPLQSIVKYKYLFLALHGIYFGAYLFFSLVIYLLPEFQFAILTGLRSEITSGSGPLAVAGKAYLSGDVLRAAWVTFLINFFLGSLASITIPSLIIPGIGIIIALFRAVMWGLLLGPTVVSLSGVMIPHSFTLLLEGEAYILATFFALLVPIYMCRKSEGPTLIKRYANALMLNLKGNFFVLTVLLIAAIYEAMEVIWSIK
ncbi:MAG: hypothetical protein ACYST2_06300 [Planctomycetota bacterium]|jgi:hypothetical protein